jgi:hypothetical protein
MMPVRGGDDDHLWLITDRKPDAVIGAARREGLLAMAGLIAWFLSFPLGLVVVAVARAWWPGA